MHFTSNILVTLLFQIFLRELVRLDVNNFSGISPLNLLDAKVKNYNEVGFATEFGISPTKPFPPKSRN